MPEDTEVGITKADAKVEDSNAAAFAKTRMLEELPPSDVGFIIGWIATNQVSHDVKKTGGLMPKGW